eukprot:GHVL01020988.1.p1 GENE.GHVL01020988.1~~GHVL01020988.1.p1  ORF type:complete len:100 (+),score=13.31 GHVL01020988.1:335-634(+)
MVACQVHFLDSGKNSYLQRTCQNYLPRAYRLGRWLCVRQSCVRGLNLVAAKLGVVCCLQCADGGCLPCPSFVELMCVGRWQGMTVICDLLPTGWQQERG